MKGSTKETSSKQEVDPELVEDYGSLMDASRLLATLRTQPNRTPSIAAFTGDQEAAFGNMRDAASAFGMGAGAGTGMPTPETTAQGFKGYSTAPEFDAAVGQLPSDYIGTMMNFLNMIKSGEGANTKQEEDTTKTKGRGGDMNFLLEWARGA